MNLLALVAPRFLRRPKAIGRALVLLAVLLLVFPCGGPGLARAQWVAFNDHAAGTGTHVNATRWNFFGPANGGPTNSGPLKNVFTGANLPVTLTLINNGAVPAAIQASAAPGSPAYAAFNGFVDFQGTPDPSAELAGAQTVTCRFTGLNPNRRYSFQGTAIRGGASYGNRWSLFELAGADSFTCAHTANGYTNGLALNQVAINTGINNTSATGDVAAWQDINPGADGTFEVISRQYTGPIPGGGSASGSKGYALTGLRLEELSPPGPASITLQPQSLMAVVGEAAIFTVGATGFPVYYQWRKDGVWLAGATNAVYTILNTAWADAGAYSVVVSDPTNSVTSADALLTVIPNQFTRLTTGAVVNDGGYSLGCAWGDYDNDGWLDLFVANSGGQNNFLYHNQGDGTFLKITAGSIVNDGGASHGCAWGDYDNDGFLDLFVSNWLGQNNFLYHNNGNSNRWLEVKCVGTDSNRSAIGARVRVQAELGGRLAWQSRDVSGGSGFDSQNSLVQHFGLGQATVIETVRVEWPSGAVQELRQVPANQSLTLIEPPANPLRIVQPPWDQYLLAGETARFSVLAVGREPLQYQWLLNGAPLPGETESKLVLSAVTTNQTGARYAVVVSNTFETVTSPAATLTVWGPVRLSCPTPGQVLANGMFSLRLAGLPERGTLVIEASTNLPLWAPVYTGPVSEGLIEFAEPVVPNCQSRFFRALIQFE